MFSDRRPLTLQTTTTIDTPRSEQRRFVHSDEEIPTLAQWAVSIEKHYGKPMDMEWAASRRNRRPLRGGGSFTGSDRRSTAGGSG